MSGGGGRVSKGRMGTSVASIDVDPDQLEKLEGQLEKVSEGGFTWKLVRWGMGVGVGVV